MQVFYRTDWVERVNVGAADESKVADIAIGCEAALRARIQNSISSGRDISRYLVPVHSDVFRDGDGMVVGAFAKVMQLT